MPARRFSKGLQSVFSYLWMLRQVFFNAAIVDAKELIRAGCHIDIIRFSLNALLVHKRIDWIVYR